MLVYPYYSSATFMQYDTAFHTVVSDKRVHSQQEGLPAAGLIIVMSEALSDDSVFSLLMVATVWEVDQFYAVYCRNRASKMFFPW